LAMDEAQQALVRMRARRKKAEEAARKRQAEALAAVEKAQLEAEARAAAEALGEEYRPDGYETPPPEEELLFDPSTMADMSEEELTALAMQQMKHNLAMGLDADGNPLKDARIG